MIGVGHYIAAPRFLACGEAIRDHNTYFMGAVVTFVGTVEPTKIYQVNYTDCVRSGSMIMKAVYSGTMYATNGGECVVSLPTLKVSQGLGWKQRADYNSDSFRQPNDW
jgi:hypothetical protein